MRLFCSDPHYPNFPSTEKKWAFEFRGTRGYLGKDHTYGSLDKALLFDSPINEYDCWQYLREYHPKSVLFHYLNPYRVVQIEVGYRVADHNWEHTEIFRHTRETEDHNSKECRFCELEVKL